MVTTEPREGQTLTSVDEMNELPVGQHVLMRRRDDTFSTYEKTTGGLWRTPAGKELPAEKLRNTVEAGLFSIPESEVMIAVSSFGRFSKREIADVVKALIDHPHFSVEYALRPLSGNSLAQVGGHILCAVAHVESLDLPDLPPKAELIRWLRNKLGVPAEDEGARVDIGADEPKRTPTGYTGGSFLLSDVERAITILQAYPGKLFRNELNRVGSPLGMLSPNHLIGPEKDKMAAKSRYIDFLSEILDSEKISGR